MAQVNIDIAKEDSVQAVKVLTQGAKTIGENVSTAIGISTDTSSTTVMGKLNNMGGGTIKSVQRGVFPGASTSPADVTIVLATINPDKAMVMLDGTTNYGSSSVASTALLISVSSDNMVIRPPLNGYMTITQGTFSWQVIEFC